MTQMSSMHLGDVRKELADLDAALAVLLELERRREGRAGLALGAAGCRVGSALPAYFCQRRLGIERIDVRRAAVHEQVDDALGLGGKLRRLGQERVAARHGRGLREGRQVAQLREGEAGQPHAAAGEEVAARHHRQLQSRVGGRGHRFSCKVAGSSLPSGRLET